jgi:hypothetical protein
MSLVHHPPACLCGARRQARLLRLVFVVTACASLQTAAVAQTDSPGAMTPEQAQQVEGAQTVEALTELGKLFFLQRQLPAAEACVVKMCEIDPDLLTDDRRHSPRSWHDFWFTQRAAIRERALAPDDAAGRVELALWLHAAGIPEAARQMLMAALEVDDSLAEAQDLADRWRLFSGGPVRFDLGYGLTQPLLLEAYTDQGVELILRRDHVFLVLPFAYEPAESKLIINKSLLRAITSEGRAGLVKGIALLEHKGGQPAGWPGGPSGRPVGSPAELGLQAGSEPLWERLEVERNADGDVVEVVCFNTVQPVVPRPAGAGRAPVQPRDRPGAPGGREVRPASGYAAFVIEVSRAMVHVDCEYRGAEPLRLEAELLAALAAPADAAGPGGERLLEFLIRQASVEQAAIAAVAVGKLAMMRGQEEDLPGEPVAADGARVRRIDAALLAAMAHPDRLTRRAAFDALIGGGPLRASMLDQVRTLDNLEALKGMLEQARKALEPPAPTAGGQDPGDPHRRFDPFFAPADGEDLVTRAVAGLPASHASPNVFAILAACLDHQDPTVRQRALDILLARPTQQSVQAMVAAGRTGRQDVIAKLAGVEKPEVKEALLRAMLTSADAEMLASLLAACSDVSLIITSESDPVLAAVTEHESGPVLEQLAALLARSDLSAVAHTGGFRRVMEAMAAHQHRPEARAGLLKLALAQFSPAYEAPIRREHARGGLPQESAIEEILASLAGSPDAVVSRAAATALVSAGRLELLNARLAQTTPERRRELVRSLSGDKSLSEREALPMFLAGRLSDEDPGTIQAALASLAIIERGLEVRERWRARLAVKQALPSAALLALTDHADDRIARQAVDLLNRLTQGSGAPVDFSVLPDQDARRDSLAILDGERAAWPTGLFACMVYLDVQPTASPPPVGLAGRKSVPLPSAQLMLRRSSAGNLEVLAGGNPIASISSPEQGVGGKLLIDAAPLLRAALGSPQAEREGLAGRVDLVWLNRARECELAYEQLGAWSGELQGQEHDMGSGPIRPLRITGARIILEPVAP